MTFVDLYVGSGRDSAVTSGVAFDYAVEDARALVAPKASSLFARGTCSSAEMKEVARDTKTRRRRRAGIPSPLSFTPRAWVA